MNTTTSPTWFALIAMADKDPAIRCGGILHRLGWRLVATRGTATALHAAGIPAQSVEEWTGTAPILGARIKTLSLPIFAALLFRPDRLEHRQDARRLRLPRVHLLLAGFYALTEDTFIDSIDVGGPAMLRAAAKNSEFTIPLVEPDDIDPVLRLLSDARGDPAAVPLDVRRRLAGNAFRHLARYDAAIARRFGRADL
jgi:phosphoribosylaminoimidazolecarboxamide formyltransferase / IMP cyclohydrolase